MAMRGRWTQLQVSMLEADATRAFFFLKNSTCRQQLFRGRNYSTISMEYHTLELLTDNTCDIEKATVAKNVS